MLSSAHLVTQYNNRAETRKLSPEEINLKEVKHVIYSTNNPDPNLVVIATIVILVFLYIFYRLITVRSVSGEYINYERNENINVKHNVITGSISINSENGFIKDKVFVTKSIAGVKSGEFNNDTLTLNSNYNNDLYTKKNKN